MDKLSSAHVYLRMHKGQTMEMITPELLEDCAQLVKANSIQGLVSLKFCSYLLHSVRRASSLSIRCQTVLVMEWVQFRC